MPTRRTFLVAAGAGFAAAGGAVALRACTDSPRRSSDPDAPCVPKSEMAMESRIGDARLVYEETRRAQSFGFDAPFHGQLEAWLADWRSGVPGLGSVTTIDTYGAWTDGGTRCASWHNAGRAFDIARLRSGDRTVVSCREDLWSTLAPADVAAHRRAYWRLAAHLNARFAYVLTYLFDDLHRNHIHVDNGISGNGVPGFNTHSRVQNQAIQACCTHVWNQPCPITGTWDGATKKASRAVLERIGRSGPLTASDNWAAFMGATAMAG